METKYLRAAIRAADMIIHDAVNKGRRPDPVEAVREAYVSIFGTAIDTPDEESRQQLLDAADIATDLVSLMRRSFEAQTRAARREAANTTSEIEQGRSP